MTHAAKILHVDGAERSRDRLERTLRERDDRFETVGVATITAASEHLGDGGIDGIVSELDLPDGDVLELLDRVRQRSGVPFVLFTDSGSEAIARNALEAGVTDYRSKGDGAHVGLARDLQERLFGGERETDSSRQDLVRDHERELARERERFSDLFENFPEPTIAYSLDDEAETRFRAANDAFESTFEFDKEAVLGERVNDLIVPDGQREESRQIDQQVGEGELIDREVRRLTATDSRIFNLRNIPVTAGGEIDGFAVYTDITERKLRERELRRQNERLEEFASIVSHDLRNPLNVAKGHLDLGRQEVDSEHLGTVAGALIRMETLIEETLELARQGETVTETEPLDLRELVEGCWEMVATGEATIDPPEGAVVHGDRERVKQLLENLFRNCVEHGSTSSRARDVTITVGTLDGGFFVADDGPGIPEDDREMIFEPGHTTSDDGTGLGLTIVNRIVEAHGWQIRVTDSETGGARFEVTDLDV